MIKYYISRKQNYYVDYYILNHVVVTPFHMPAGFSSTWPLLTAQPLDGPERGVEFWQAGVAGQPVLGGQTHCG